MQQRDELFVQYNIFNRFECLLSYPALRRVSTLMALSRASSVMTIVETGIRKDFMGHVIVLISRVKWLQDRGKQEGGRDSMCVRAIGVASGPNLALSDGFA